MRVPFLDLGAAYTELAAEFDRAYHEVMRSGRYLLGSQLEAFEHEFSAAVGAAHCAGVGSGLDALVLGLQAIGVGSGDDVLVPTNTIVLTWLAVAAVGAHPVGVEPDPATYTIDPGRLEGAHTARTRAVIPVHLYGRPSDVPAVMEWARAHQVRVLCDAAQAHGALVHGTPVGALGDAVAWSFYPSKNLGAFADAGCVTSDDAEVTARVRRLRNYGSAQRDEVLEVGRNSRLDELQAAFLRVRLRHLDEWNQRRRAVAARYRRDLSGLPLILPPADDSITSAWHQFVVRVADRPRVREELQNDGVQTLVHYPVPPFAHPVFADLGIAPGTYRLAEQLAAEVLSLPIGPHLSDRAAAYTTERLLAALVG